MAATGTPLELVEKSEGGGARESYRRFLFSSLAPVARLVGAELADKLGVDGLNLNFDALMAGDIQSRARSLASMTNAGMPLDRAALLAGLSPDAG